MSGSTEKKYYLQIGLIETKYSREGNICHQEDKISINIWLFFTLILLSHRTQPHLEGPPLARPHMLLHQTDLNTMKATFEGLF